MSGVGSRRTSALFDDRRERNHHLISPSARSRERILTPDLFDLGGYTSSPPFLVWLHLFLSSPLCHLLYPKDHRNVRFL